MVAMPCSVTAAAGGGGGGGGGAAAVAGAPCTSTSYSKTLAPAASYQMPLPLPCCRPSLRGSFKGLPVKRSLFLGGVSTLHGILLLASPHSSARGLAHVPSLQVVSAHKKAANTGSDSEGNILKSRRSSWDGTNVLAVAEGCCLVVAAASYTTSVFRDKQASLVASSPAEVSKFLPKLGDLSTWHVPAFWAALVINVVLRTVHRKSSTKSTQKVWEERSIKDFTLDQRVGKLEEDVQSVNANAQMLSRHLEKLGVRFRVTRRTLRDPIQETVELSQKTSEVVRALANREKFLEKELEETQRVLVAMQMKRTKRCVSRKFRPSCFRDCALNTQTSLLLGDSLRGLGYLGQQAKQLELLVAGMTKTLRSQQASERRILKELSRRLGEEAHSSEDGRSSVPNSKEKGGALSNGRSRRLMKDTKSLWKGMVPNQNTNSISSSSSQIKGPFKELANAEAKVKHSVKENGHSGMTHDAKEGQGKKSAYLPDTSFTKEDFWATATPRVNSDNSESPQIRRTDAEPQHGSEPLRSTSSGRLDAFFSNKKRIHIPEADLPQERDFSNPSLDQLFSQGGEPSSGSSSGSNDSVS